MFDDDMQPQKACTSTLQMWHNKGREDTINVQPVMEVMVKNSWTVMKGKLEQFFFNHFISMAAFELHMTHSQQGCNNNNCML